MLLADKIDLHTSVSLRSVSFRTPNAPAPQREPHGPVSPFTSQPDAITSEAHPAIEAETRPSKQTDNPSTCQLMTSMHCRTPTIRPSLHASAPLGRKPLHCAANADEDCAPKSSGNARAEGPKKPSSPEETPGIPHAAPVEAIQERAHRVTECSSWAPAGQNGPVTTSMTEPSSAVRVPTHP